MTPAPTAEVPEGSGAETGPGGAAAGEGDTSNATAVEADAVGAGGCHGAEKRERERFVGQQENPAGESSGEATKRGDPRPP